MVVLVVLVACLALVFLPLVALLLALEEAFLLLEVDLEARESDVCSLLFRSPYLTTKVGLAPLFYVGAKSLDDLGPLHPHSFLVESESNAWVRVSAFYQEVSNVVGLLLAIHYHYVYVYVYVYVYQDNYKQKKFFKNFTPQLDYIIIHSSVSTSTWGYAWGYV